MIRATRCKLAFARRSKEVYEWTVAKGVTIISAQDVHELGPKVIAERAAAVVGDGSTYLSFDIDALDPAFAPGTGTPEIGGLASWQMQAILRRLSESPFRWYGCRRGGAPL